MATRRISKLTEPSMRLYFICAIIFALATFVESIPRIPLAAVECAAFAGLYYYFRSTALKRREAIQRYIDTVTDDMTTADKASMLSAPIAMMVFRPDTQELLWSNDSFRTLTGVKESLLNNHMGEVLPEFSYRWLLEGKSESAESIIVNGRHFHVYGTLARPSGTRRGTLLATTYWIDVTEADMLREENKRSKPIVGIVMVDNYEELMKAGTEASRSALLARINEKLSTWLEGTDSLFCRLDRNRYLFVISQEKYDELAQAKFSVLDSVREVVTEDGVTATLSIGVGKDVEDFGTLYKYASLSIEMALSRGGDQVVVRNQIDFEFFGGKSQASEKRTKVKSRVMANALGELISDATQVFIMGHKHADMDAVGAAAGVMCIARKRGKKAQIVIDTENNAAGAVLARLRELPEYENAFISGNDAFIMARSGALLVIVDTNRPDFVESEPLLDACNRVAVIDHHRRAASYIENAALNFHEPYASSASELVTELLQYLVEPGDILRAEAEALLAGVVLDTKNFTRRTGGRTFEAAAFLRRVGADTTDVQRLFQGNLGDMIERYNIIRHAEMYRDDIAVAAIDEEVDRVTAAKATDELLTLQGVRASFVLFRHGTGVNLSARSLGEINVQMIAEKLGGGGNSTTAGAQVPEETLAAVRSRLLEAIDRYFEE
ncbi:MAG: DHH family phosphoesterase [Oscillospiraceae bacterium]|nr:DHH family phosphoesterase [Oscillospiraceae bacterium]